MYYIEGIIDAIDFLPNATCFSLIPSAEFLLKIDGDKTMALFVQDAAGMMPNPRVKNAPIQTAKALNAKLISPVNNQSGKGTLWFLAPQSVAICPRNILLDVKNNRNCVRVRVADPDSRKQITGSTPLAYAISAYSMRIK